MAGWHHRCNEYELGQTLGDGKGQGGLACCSPWGHKEWDIVTKQQQQLVPVFPGGSVAKNPPSKAGDSGSVPESGRSLKEEMATRSSLLAWRIPRTEEPGGLQPTGLQSRTRLSTQAATAFLRTSFNLFLNVFLQASVKFSAQTPDGPVCFCRWQRSEVCIH